MRRRDLLVGLAGTGVAAGGLLMSTRSPHDESGFRPVTLERLEGRGSVRVPASERATVVELFATWCRPCIEQLRHLRATHRDADATYISVTNEALGSSLTREDLREWWDTHGGEWPVGLDTEGIVTRRLEAPGLPFLAIFDKSGSPRFSHRGVAEAELIASKLEAVE